MIFEKYAEKCNFISLVLEKKLKYIKDGRGMLYSNKQKKIPMYIISESVAWMIAWE